MRLARPLTAALLALALFALPASISAAAEIVPPGNSAASQYTEAFPTTGGERETEDHSGKAVPAKTLGARNAKQLESKGKDGKAVAEFAAETAPAPVVTEAGQDGGSEPAGGDGGDKGKSDAAGGGGAAGGSAGGGSGGSPASSASDRAATATLVAVEEPSGSSGFGEVLGEATGSSSGKLGWFLPLIVIGAVLWSLFYLWRQRQRGQRVA